MKNDESERGRPRPLQRNYNGRFSTISSRLIPLDAAAPEDGRAPDLACALAFLVRATICVRMIASTRAMQSGGGPHALQDAGAFAKPFALRGQWGHSPVDKLESDAYIETMKAEIDRNSPVA